MTFYVEKSYHLHSITEKHAQQLVANVDGVSRKKVDIEVHF